MKIKMIALPTETFAKVIKTLGDGFTHNQIRQLMDEIQISAVDYETDAPESGNITPIGGKKAEED